jgi:hypothetical protein
MALYEENGVSEEQLKGVAFTVTTNLKGKCKFCPRGFEPGEQMVFGTIKNIQMQWLEADVETSEPAGFGEAHVVDIINAHLPCAITNSSKFRSVTAPRNL